MPRKLSKHTTEKGVLRGNYNRLKIVLMELVDMKPLLLTENLDQNTKDDLSVRLLNCAERLKQIGDFYGRVPAKPATPEKASKSKSDANNANHTTGVLPHA